MNLSSFRGGLTDYRQAVRDALAPRPDQRVYQWMEQHCSVRGENEGKYSTNLTPYVREWFDCFNNKRIEDLTLCTGTQVAKTTTVMGGVSYRLVTEPGETLWVMPDKDFSGSFSRQKWQPFVEECAPLAALLPQGPARRKFMTTMEQRFGRAVLYFVGSNSATQVAGRSCGLVVMDETDKFGKRTAREAGALQNAEERVKTFNYPLLVKTSTPTDIYGEIWVNFLLGDQRYYFVPCPFCHEQIQLVWPQVRWWDDTPDEAKTDGTWDMAKVRRNAHYKCQRCEEKILSHHKADMMREGEWKPTVTTNESTRRSYHLNSLYAPWKKTHFPELAVQFLNSRSSLSARQKFINSTLAEPFDLEQSFDIDPIKTTGYLPAEIQRDRTPLMTVDVQAETSHFWVVIRAWAPTGESWLLHAGKCESRTDLEVLAGKYNVNPNHVMLDIAHMTNTVCQWLVELDWRGAWGSDQRKFTHRLLNGTVIEKIVSQVKMRDPWIGTARQNERNRPALYVNWANDPIRDQLAIRRFAEPAIWHVHGDAPQEYLKHLNAYQKIMRKTARRGRYESVWHQFGRQDHLLDCECMQIVLAMMAEIITEEAGNFGSEQGILFRSQDLAQG